MILYNAMPIGEQKWHLPIIVHMACDNFINALAKYGNFVHIRNKKKHSQSQVGTAIRNGLPSIGISV